MPIGLVLGFFVDLVASRWWAQFQCLPWPDELAIRLCACVENKDDGNDSNGGHQQMQKLLRYIHLAYGLGLRWFVATARNRYPTHQSFLAEGGLD